ncbi:MAG: hypothetical protein JJT77_10515 [Crocinitomicaceae bacterium]|nr:hypothetical protein [Crocinitomicaceae bacterium]
MGSKYLILIFLLLSSVFSNGQNITRESKDTMLYDKYEGKIVFQKINTDTALIRQGKIFFRSELHKDLKESALKRIVIDGNYSNNLKNGEWKIAESKFDILIADVTKRRDIYSIDYELEGIVYDIKMNFNNGIRQGEWTINKSIIDDNRKKPQKNNGKLYFDSGLLVDHVFYSNEEDGVSIDFNLNKEGFIDGESVFKYLDNGKRITEKRYYENGFLLRIEKSEDESRNPFEIIVFEDISEKLDFISKNPHQDKYEISNDGFGLLFDNGYNASKELKTYIDVQLKGNNLVEKLLGEFDKYLTSSPNEQRSPRFNFTRRLKYIYERDELEKLKGLKKELLSACETYSDFVNQPRNRLYKTKSANLSEAMVYIINANKKCEIILTEIDKMILGKYDYLYRPNFYSKGIRGLDEIDTLKYRTPNNDTLEVVFDLGLLITSHDQLVDNLIVYTHRMFEKTADYKNLANQKVKLFSQQEIIDELDSMILYAQVVNDSLYGDFLTLKSKPFQDLMFSQKIYFVYQNELLSEIKDDYLVSQEFEEKQKLGNQLVCYKKMFNNQYTALKDLGDAYGSIDSLFTVYEENPFDYRKFESKILGNIREKGGRVLFRSYIEELLKIVDCEEIPNKIEKMNILLERLTYLAENYKTEEAVRINRLIRRESVPGRIERVLGLNNK